MSSYASIKLHEELTSRIPHFVLRLFRRNKVLDAHEEGSVHSFVAPSPEVVVFLEMVVQVLLQNLVSDEPHAADRTLELDVLIEFFDDAIIRSIR